MVAPNPNFAEDSGNQEEPQGPDFEPRDAGRQPACPADLESSPPASEVCGEFRQMMRDFADGDLSDVETAAVESHAHDCRSCALALSRAESERMQITTALGELDPSSVGPSPMFTETVMQRVRELAVTQPSVGFTPRVMARVREAALTEAVLGPAGSPTGSPPGRHRLPIYLVLAATVLFAAWIGMAVFEPPMPAIVEVVAAEHAEMVRDGGRISLVATNHWDTGEHRATDEFVTGGGGSLDLLWRPDGTPIALRAGEDTKFRVGVAGRAASGMPATATAAATVAVTVALREGALAVRTDVGVRLVLEDGSSIGIDRGDYAVTVQGVRHQDARAGLLVSVHVRDGVARIERGGRATVVAAGSQARYTSFTPITVVRAPGDQLFHDSRRRGRAAVVATPAAVSGERRFFGQVLDPRTSTPVANVTVAISTFLGDQTVTTDAAGMFELTGQREFRGQFVLIRAVPPANVPGLAPLRFTPVFLDPRDESAGGRADAVRRFFLERAGVVRGRIHDANRRPPVGLWLQAVAVDELLGVAVPIGPRVAGGGVGYGAAGYEAASYEAGGFVIDGLSTEPQAQRTLLIVAGAKGCRARVVWARSAVRVEDSVLELVLPRARDQWLDGFAPGEAVHLLMAIEGVPVGSGVWSTTRHADTAGRVRLDLSAPVFVLSATEPPRLLVGNSGAAAEFVAVALPATLAALRVGSLAADRVHWFHKDKLPVVAQVQDDGGFVSVYEESSGQACPGATVFLQAADGSISFLGVYDGHAPLPCASGTVGRLLVRTPEGWVGHLDFDGSLGRARRKSIAVQKPGYVDWHGAGSGVVVLRRATGSRPRFPIVRQGDETHWRLHPGNYRFGASPLRVDADTTTPLK